MPASDPRDPQKQQRLIEFRNASGQAIPSFGVLQITGSEDAGIGRKILTITRPDGTAGATFAINSHLPVAAPVSGSTSGGMCTLDFPTMAAYATGDGTPAVNEVWGPKSGQFTLAKGMPGFSICGSPASGRVLIGPWAGHFIIGKTDAAHAADASGTISVWSKYSGSDTGVNLENVVNPFGDLEIDKWVLVVCINGEYTLAAGRCQDG